MMISAGGNAWNSALQAYNRGTGRVDAAAERIASGSVDSSQNFGASEAVDLKMGQMQAEAGTKVMDPYNKTIGSIIDIEC